MVAIESEFIKNLCKYCLYKLFKKIRVSIKTFCFFELNDIMICILKR